MDSQVTSKEGDCQPLGAMDNLKRDRFELLSAYLDGEVTAAERRQVEDWLEHDLLVQCLYARLLKLRQGMRALPIPPSTQSVEQTAQQVISRIDRRPKLAMAWGGVAIAALFIGVLSNRMPASQTSAPQLAISSPGSEVASDVTADALMIALDRPVMEIPKAPVSVGRAQVGQAGYEPVNLR